MILSGSQVIDFYIDEKTGIIESLDVDDLVFTDIQDKTVKALTKKLVAYLVKRSVMLFKRKARDIDLKDTDKRTFTEKRDEKRAEIEALEKELDKLQEGATSF
jgi:hypothetical protein